jgi:hypothetical protein
MCIQLHACIVYRDEGQGMRVGGNMKRWIRDDRQVHRIALNPQILSEKKGPYILLRWERDVW